MKLFESIEVLYSGDLDVWDCLYRTMGSEEMRVLRTFVRNKHAEESRVLRESYGSAYEWFREGAFEQSRIDEEMHRAMLRIGYI